MDYYSLQSEEVVLYQGNVHLKDIKDDVEFTLTNLHFIYKYTKTVKKLFASKEEVVVDIHPVEKVKIYNDLPQIKQSNNDIVVYLTTGEIFMQFDSKTEIFKFMNASKRLLTGKTMAKRGSEKVKSAIGLVNDALGIDTVGAVKGVLEKGIVRSLIGGIGDNATTKSKPAVTPTATTNSKIEKANAIIDSVGKVKEILDSGDSNKALSADNSHDLVDQVEQLKKLKELLDLGAITQEEFDAKKSELLAKI